MNKLRFYDMRVSTLPEDVGLCKGDFPRIAQYVNNAQRRLLYAKEAGDEGWWGTWAEMAFTVSLPPTQASPNLPGPYLTLPRQVARLEGVNVCEFPIQIQNQFYEYLEFGNGRMPKTFKRCFRMPLTQAFTRNNVPTFIDLTNPPQIIAVYLTDPSDIGKRVLLQGTDNSNNTIFSQDALFQVTGQYVSLQSPFATAPIQMNSITGIQKDITSGQVKFYQMDPTTGTQVLLLTMDPGETVASYRRYFFHDLPANCCLNALSCPQNQPSTIPVTALCKLDLIPVVGDTDYCLIQNQEALNLEAQSIFHSKVDNTASKQLSQEEHKQAIRLLMGELVHYLGKNEPAVGFHPFGLARLERQKIGNLL